MKIISNNTTTTTLSLFLLSALMLLSHTNAFTASVIAPSSSSTRTRLHASTIYSDFGDSSRRNRFTTRDEPQQDEPQDIPTAVPQPQARSRLSKMDMPRHGPTAQEIQSAKLLMSMEMTIGRGAMMVAVLLMGTELVTGMSLPEQVSHLF
ncbi:expressed unknown protein [Seminavis robusta]|uniref:Uncharacterized protein n=1 Tax=Seminavis robusta TaxID=568900 RepID=A0A9N8EN95_9STRA|nr:expressed unknown protein [Seminavis robusta]|eukprot:Sro1215_g253200.1 n/a (150) ;mRNA; f:21164-21613